MVRVGVERWIRRELTSILTSKPVVLDALTTEPRMTEVYDRPAEVGGECVRLPEVSKAAGRPDERFLGKVLGHVLVARQEPGQGGRPPDMLLVQDRQRATLIGHLSPLLGYPHSL